MKSNENAVVYNTEETVNELNKVKGFDPMKYVRNTENGAVLDLPYQKLWFRLKHPNGKVRLFIQKISDKASAIEARVFFDRRDSEPIANHIVSGVDITDKTAVTIAQRSAIGNALSDAGFGLQFVSATPNTTEIKKEPGKMVVTKPQTETVPKAVKEEPKPAEKPTTAEEPKNVILKEETVPTETKEETPTQPHVTDTVTENVAKDSTPEPVVTEQPEEKQSTSQVDPLLSVVSSLTNNGIKIDTNTGEVLEETESEQPSAQTDNTTDETPTDSVVTEEAPVKEETPAPAEKTVSYTKETPVEEICKVMTLEEAMDYVVEGGPFNGNKLGSLAKIRPARTFDMIIEKYPTKDNILKAAATLVRDSMLK